MRPQVEYAATVWDPYTTDNIKKVEAVQRRAARFVTGDYRYTSSATVMTESVSWETLQHRRQQATLTIMMYRIVHAMVAIPASPHLQLLGAATRGHQYKYSPILQDQYIQGFLLPVKYPTVEPAARETDKR